MRKAADGPRLGKRVGGALYLHRDALRLLDADIQARVLAAEAASGARDWNVLKIEAKAVSLLEYEDFDASAFPRLLASARIAGERVVRTDYRARANPPILHRKERLLHPDDPRIPRFASLTRTAEERGLFSASHTIGTERAWLERIAEAGLIIDGQVLAPGPAGGEPVEIARHRTAIGRTRLSAPMQALVRHDFIQEGVTVLDYGCGQGDDVRALREGGIAATGWDPHFLPDADLAPADVVNLGFVLNVIESRAERVETLRRAWSYCRRVLAVAVMVAGHRPTAGLQPYGDGYLTSRGTFQRYFTPIELREIIGEATGVEAVAVANGVAFAFREAADERDFLFRRQVRRAPREVQFRPSPRERTVSVREPLAERMRPVLEAVWTTMLTLGRSPAPDEIPSGVVEALKGSNISLGRAVAWCETLFEREAYEQAARDRRDDLVLYFALGTFTRSAALADLADNLRRDARAFFGGVSKARDASQSFLFTLGDASRIKSACERAVELGLAYRERDGVIHFRADRRESLPLELRGFVGCASVIFGDLDEAEILRINAEKGTLSLYFVADFYAKLPSVTRIARVDLRRQAIHDRQYGGADDEVLLCRSAYASDQAEREERRSMEERIHRLLGLPQGRMTVPRGDIARALRRREML
ncbi:DNA phosphorothioation-associated putative methyltransferase [Methylobacterium indicum]|uniref:DNA phosphorothioation-associated putative methyltransferase n=1 Tax=Methylobacterium indicum TaxID=1775910 RepID=UPI002435E739|nr:DNA phosphorothioation-associated putative methyltransferase [Methylobacterium indicum]